MTLSEYILTYKGQTSTGDTGFVANIPDYYDKVVQPLADKFREYSLNGSRLAICPLHEDTDPSLGLINHRFLKGVKVYHCFGCNSSGTIIRLHQRIVSKYDKREISEEESCRELAQIFNIPLDDYESIEDEDTSVRFTRTLKHIETLKGTYTQKDFEQEVRKVRYSGNVDLNAINSACVKMIATSKQLYS